MDKRLVIGLCIFFLILGCSKAKQTPEYMRETLSPLIEQYVDVVFSGNDHNYQRSYPMKAEQIVEEGTTYIVVGSGGSQLRDFDRAHWQARGAKEYMFIHVVVKGNTAEFTAINDDGRIIDRFDIVK